MERLTEHYGDRYIRIKGCNSFYPREERKSAPASNAVVRLAAYEDTELSPEEIMGLCEMDRRAKMADLVRLEEYQALGPVEELSALVKAWDEERMVVLPEVSQQDRQSMAAFLRECLEEWAHDPYLSLYDMTDGMLALFDAIITVITSAEAETALGGGGDVR